MRMSKSAIVLVISLSLAVPTFGSPSDSTDPGHRTGIITRVLNQIKHFLLGATAEPSVPIPQIPQINP